MEVKSDVIFNGTRICRFCLSQAGVMSPIFDQGEPNSLPLSSKITAILSIQLYMNDGLPSIICHRCLYQMEKFYDFKNQCESSDSMLRKYLSAMQTSFSSRLQINTDNSEGDCFNMLQLQKSMVHSSNYTDSPFKRKRGRPRKEENLIFYSSPVHPQIDSNSIPNFQDDQIKFVDGIESVVTVVDPRSEMLSNSEDEIKNEVENEVQIGENEKNEIGMVNNNDDDDTTKSLAIARAKAKVYMSVVVGVDDNGVKSRRHLCIGCGKTFGHSSDLRKHVLVHTGERPFHCQICTKTFSRRTNLNKHMKVHTGQKPFCCTNCTKSFATKGDLQRHMIIHSGIKPFSCHLCNQCFSRKDKLTRHLKLHETNSVRKPALSCTLCPAMYNTKVELDLHVELSHFKMESKEEEEEPCVNNVDEESSNDLPGKMEELSAEDESEEAKDRQGGDKDEGSQDGSHEEEVESMVINIDPFPVDSEMNDSFQYWENEDELSKAKPESPNAKRPRSDDSKSSETPRRRRKTSGGKKVLMCKICDKTFIELTYLRSHMATHSTHKPHQCSRCDKSFTRRRELLRHENVHTGVKPFTCKVCNKAFSRKDKLVRHEKIHNGLKRLNCGHCGAVFNKAEELLHHQSTHSEELGSWGYDEACSQVSSSHKLNGVDYESDELDSEEERDTNGPLEQLNGNPAITVTSIPKSVD